MPLNVDVVTVAKKRKQQKTLGPPGEPKTIQRNILKTTNEK